MATNFQLGIKWWIFLLSTLLGNDIQNKLVIVKRVFHLEDLMILMLRSFLFYCFKTWFRGKTSYARQKAIKMWGQIAKLGLIDFDFLLCLKLISRKYEGEKWNSLEFFIATWNFFKSIFNFVLEYVGRLKWPQSSWNTFYGFSCLILLSFILPYPKFLVS